MCYGWAIHLQNPELRNTVSEVNQRAEGGERLTVTVDRRPVAEIVPLRRRRTVSATEALAIASRHAADSRLLVDVRGPVPDATGPRRVGALLDTSFFVSPESGSPLGEMNGVTETEVSVVALTVLTVAVLT